MSLTAIMVCCVLGCDFLIYAFFRLVYGKKRLRRSRRRAVRANAARTLMPRRQPDHPHAHADRASGVDWSERLAYNAIVASFARPRR